MHSRRPRPAHDFLSSPAGKSEFGWADHCPASTHCNIGNRPLGGDPAADIYSGGIASKTVRFGGMTAQAGLLRAKIAIFGWKVDESSKVPAYTVN
jgi:hypothetical protein